MLVKQSLKSLATASNRFSGGNPQQPEDGLQLPRGKLMFTCDT
jgi:hypothetical protein